MGMIAAGCVRTDACAQLQVAPGAYWNHSGAVYTVLDDMDLLDNGVFSDVSGTMKFAGNNGNTVSGAAIPGFYHLEIAKNNTLFLQQDCAVGQDILFTSGIIDLNGRIITLSPAAQLVSESETSRITGVAGGYITITTPLNAPSGIDPGNLGAEITTAQNLGSTTIRRGHQSQNNGAGNGILRYFDILPANNAALNATLRFHYFDAELNGLAESNLTVWGSPDNSSWTDRGFSTRDVTANYVDRDAISAFDRWTLSAPGNSLPVTFVFLRERCTGNATLLQWQTGLERHSSRFDIQRSSDASYWQVIGSVPAAGNSSMTHDYSFMDASPSGATCFYRVVEYDEDGRPQYAPVVSSGCGIGGPDRAWPNPCVNSLFVQIQLAEPARLLIKTYDEAGALVDVMQKGGYAGFNEFEVDMRSKPAGVYHVVVEWGGGRRYFTVVRL